MKDTRSIAITVLFVALLLSWVVPPLYRGYTARAAAAQREQEELKRQYYRMLVKYEGWHWAPGLPRPIPPRPGRKTVPRAEQP